MQKGAPVLNISNNVSLDENEITFEAIRAQGSGGQKVNKTSVAIHLRFDIDCFVTAGFLQGEASLTQR